MTLQKLKRCVNRFLQQWPALLSYFESHADVEKPGRVKRCADYLRSVEMKAYFLFLSFILQPLNTFNTLFQTDATQIALLAPEMTGLLRLFMAKFVSMRAIKTAADLTTVLHDEILNIGLETEDEIENSTHDRIFTSIRDFYMAVVKMIRIFPLNDEVLRDLAVLNTDPQLRDNSSPETVRNLATRFELLTDNDLECLVVEFQDYQLGADSELPPYTSETRTDVFWPDMGKTETFSGEARFPLLACLMTTLSVMHSILRAKNIQ